MSTIEHLQWRYATKQYDKTKKLSDEQRHIIMEALRLAPSSFGFQPWKFIHVTDPALRQQLRAAAYNQPQLTDASDVFVLCSANKLDESDVDHFLASVAQTRQVTVESLADYRKSLMNAVGRPDAAEWNARQLYIALGVALAAAAENHIDASPMEGFDTKQFDQILGLAALGVTSRAILAVGFRSTDDAYQQLKKVRYPREEVFIER